MADPTITALAEKLLVNRWLHEVNTGSKAEPIWTVVRGVKETKLSASKNKADTSDFDSGAFKTSTTTSLEGTLEIKIGVGLDDAGLPDPGQAFLEGKQFVIGKDDIVQVRVSEMGATRGKAYIITGPCEYTPEGGDIDATDEVSVTVTGPIVTLDTHPYPLAG